MNILYKKFSELNQSFYRQIKAVFIPDLKFSQLIYEEVLRKYIKCESRWLDLGCGHRILPEWRFDSELNLIKRVGFVIGFDRDYVSIKKHRSLKYKILGDINLLPFLSNSFDLITANMVFEHLVDPKHHLAEIYRVLKNDGLLIFHTPNINSYGPGIGRVIPGKIKNMAIYFLENRCAEDIYPTYYRINKMDTIKDLCLSSGFILKELRSILTTPIFIQIAPLLLLEILLLKTLKKKKYEKYRPNIIAVLQKHS